MLVRECPAREIQNFKVQYLHFKLHFGIEAVLQSRSGQDRRAGNKKIDGFKPSIFLRLIFGINSRLHRCIPADTSYPGSGRRSG